MKNTFESAKSYIQQLDKIDTNWNLNKETITSAFISYAEKVAKTPNRETLIKFAEQYRKLQRQWDLFDMGVVKNKPLSLRAFIDTLVLESTENEI